MEKRRHLCAFSPESARVCAVLGRKTKFCKSRYGRKTRSLAHSSVLNNEWTTLVMCACLYFAKSGLFSLFLSSISFLALSPSFPLSLSFRSLQSGRISQKMPIFCNARARYLLCSFVSVSNRRDPIFPLQKKRFPVGFEGRRHWVGRIRTATDQKRITARFAD